MTKFSSHFPKAPVLLVVIHVESETQAFENANIAFEQGAHGIFLINHSMGPGHLRDIYEKMRVRYPTNWIGLNFLGSTLRRIFEGGLLPEDASGIWTDNTGYGEDPEDPTFVPLAVERMRKKSEYSLNALYFGGVSFKHQHDTSNIEAACRAAASCAPFVDVITTSGAQTGTEPSLVKITSMRAALGKHPLAVASGMTPENIRPFLPYVDAFLVATGISRSHSELEPSRVLAMSNIIRNA